MAGADGIGTHVFHYLQLTFERPRIDRASEVSPSHDASRCHILVVSRPKEIRTNDGGYVVGGSFTGTNLQVGEVSTGLTNTTNDLKGIVIKLSSSGSYEWAKEVAHEGLDYDVTALTQNLEGNIVAGVTTGENPKVIEYTNTDGNINGETTISANVQISDMDGYNSQDVIIVSQGLTDTTTGRIDLYSNGSVTAGKWN